MIKMFLGGPKKVFAITHLALRRSRSLSPRRKSKKRRAKIAVIVTALIRRAVGMVKQRNQIQRRRKIKRSPDLKAVQILQKRRNQTKRRSKIGVIIKAIDQDVHMIKMTRAILTIGKTVKSQRKESRFPRRSQKNRTIKKVRNLITRVARARKITSQAAKAKIRKRKRARSQNLTIGPKVKKLILIHQNQSVLETV